jgi:hypothetical protein
MLSLGSPAGRYMGDGRSHHIGTRKGQGGSFIETVNDGPGHSHEHEYAVKGDDYPARSRHRLARPLSWTRTISLYLTCEPSCGATVPVATVRTSVQLPAITAVSPDACGTAGHSSSGCSNACCSRAIWMSRLAQSGRMESVGRRTRASPRQLEQRTPSRSWRWPFWAMPVVWRVPSQRF